MTAVAPSRAMECFQVAGPMPRLRGWLAVVPMACLSAGLSGQGLGHPEIATWAWAIATLIVIGVLLAQVVTSLKKVDVGLDLVALLSMGGTLALSQPLAGAVIALMYAGGQSLEAYASGRAGRAMTVLIAIDGIPAAALEFADPPRLDGGNALLELRACGIERVVLATGDRRAVAEALVAGLPVDGVAADLDPTAKTETVAAERRNGPVMMVGDGINDAPALAAADLGVALGARGAAAAAEAADVVLLVDSLAPLPHAIRIALHARAIALQSVWVGLGLSLAGMIAAALGYLSPLQGALMQEAIDVAVSLNAMRVLGGPQGGRMPEAPGVPRCW